MVASLFGGAIALDRLNNIHLLQVTECCTLPCNEDQVSRRHKPSSNHYVYLCTTDYRCLTVRISLMFEVGYKVFQVLLSTTGAARHSSYCIAMHGNAQQCSSLHLRQERAGAEGAQRALSAGPCSPVREMREEKEGFGGGGSGSPPPPMTPRRVSRPKMRAVAVIGQSTRHSWGSRGWTKPFQVEFGTLVGSKFTRPYGGASPSMRVHDQQRGYQYAVRNVQVVCILVRVWGRWGGYLQFGGVFMKWRAAIDG